MAKDVYELIAREYGIELAETVDGIATVAAATPVMILRQNPRRVAFTFQNLSANPLGILNAVNIVAATRQFTVAAGGVATFNWKEDLDLPAYEWWVLGTAAAEAFMVRALLIAGGVAKDN